MFGRLVDVNRPVPGEELGGEYKPRVTVPDGASNLSLALWHGLLKRIEGAESLISPLFFSFRFGSSASLKWVVSLCCSVLLSVLVVEPLRVSIVL